MTARIVDLFAGPGGWDEGLRILGRDDVVGVELDKDIAATREAAGLATIHANVLDVGPGDFAGIEGLIASPPCQTFSSAGKQAGLSDPRGRLVFEVIKWARITRPEWIACEEVSEVLPIWRAFASDLREMGYHATALLLNAADYGVPQSRKRAFLMASRRPFAMPTPTHSQNGGGLFDDLPRWVTMAEALGLTDGDRTELNGWAWERPATTVVRSFRPDVIAAPGYRLAGDGPRQNTPGSITVTPDQLKTLQSVRHDFPIVASKTKSLSIIGAFIPPPLTAAVLAPLLATSTWSPACRECGNDDPTTGHLECSDCLERTAA